VASRIVHDGKAPAEPAASTDAFRHFVADAHRFFWIADKIVSGAVNCAQGAPLGGRLIVPRDWESVRGARERTPCPVRRINDECAGVDQHLLLYGRGQGLPLFVRDQEPLRRQVDLKFMSRKGRRPIGVVA
jgi:hypothetical protein